MLLMNRFMVALADWRVLTESVMSCKLLMADEGRSSIERKVSRTPFRIFFRAYSRRSSSPVRPLAFSLPHR